MKNDVFNATGDIFPATGKLMISRKKDPFNAQRDVFRNTGGDDDDLQPLEETNLAQDSGYKIQDGKVVSSTTTKKDGSKVLNLIDQLMGVVSEGADVYNKLKYGGTSGSESGVDYNAKLSDDTAPKSNMIWYIAGGVIISLIVVVVVMNKKGKK